MSRVKGSTPTRNRRKGFLKLAKGYFGSKHRLFRTAHEQVMRSWKYAYRDRRNIKRDFRKLWITRINAAAAQCEISYSRLTYGLKCAGIDINRKMLSELAIQDYPAFEQIVKLAKDALAKGIKPVEKPVVVAPKKEPKKVVAEPVKTVEVEVKPASKKEVKVAAEPAPKTSPKKEVKAAVEVAPEAAKKPAAKKAAKVEPVEEKPAEPTKKPRAKKAAE